MFAEEKLQISAFIWLADVALFVKPERKVKIKPIHILCMGF
jgi:hypothetical protein